jgi:hypothetical protein
MPRVRTAMTDSELASPEEELPEAPEPRPAEQHSDEAPESAQNDGMNPTSTSSFGGAASNAAAWIQTVSSLAASRARTAAAKTGQQITQAAASVNIAMDKGLQQVCVLACLRLFMPCFVWCCVSVAKLQLAQLFPATGGRGHRVG